MVSEILARYPFLEEAREYLKDVKLSDILNSPIYRRVRSLAVERIKACYTGKMPRMIDSEERFLSYHIAKLILMAMNDPIITIRYANMERDRLEERLKASKEDVEIVARSLGLRFEPIRREIDGLFYSYRIHFIDFIKYAKNFSTDDFRLIYQPIDKGWLLITDEKMIKIVREAFVEKFVNEVNSSGKDLEAIRKKFEREIEEIRNLKDDYLSRYKPVEFEGVNADAFPPCIKRIMARIESGENVSHQARFSLVTFLHRIGMGEEEILNIFSTVPDFKRDMTLYQIRHITGKISGKEYSVPKCATMRAYGLCVKDAVNDKLCNQPWMTHPLLYYKIKMEKSVKDSSRRK